MGFRYLSISVTMNDFEWRNALNLRYFTNPVALGAHYVNVVEDRPILSG